MTVSRRTFVKASLVTLPLCKLGGCGNDVAAAPIVDAAVDDDPSSTRYGQIGVPVPRYPDLAAVGGAVMLRLAPLPPGTRPFTMPALGVLLVHRAGPDDPPEFVATRADCPHQGCPLGYSAKDGLIECPCHGSRFRAVADVNDPALCAGQVLHAPAADDLTVYGVQRSGDYVYVDLRDDQSCGISGGFPAVVGGKVTLPIAQFPQLATVGGSLIGKPDGLNDKLIVGRVATDQVIAVSAICTHKQCTVGLQVGNQRLHCPCHGSNFTYAGANIDGIAPAPLKSYPVDFLDGQTVVISVA